MFIFLLIKLHKTRERAESLLDGKLYCNRVKVLAKRFDKYEGVTRLWGDKLVFKINGHTFTKKDFAAPLEFKHERPQNCHAYCMYSARIDEETVEKAETGTNLLTIPSRCVNEFGEHVVVIKDYKEFFDRIHKAAVAQGYGLKADLVKYYNPEKPPPEIHEALLPEHVLKQAFYKDEEFQDEQEFRFLIETATIGDNCLWLEIGDIRDIAIYSSFEDLTLHRS